MSYILSNDIATACS